MLNYARTWQTWHRENSKCIRTVFKIQSTKFTGTSRTPREGTGRGGVDYSTVPQKGQK